ncbi:MAG: hypothetical protein WDM96_11470 [Lacunisphaera sp.]
MVEAVRGLGHRIATPKAGGKRPAAEPVVALLTPDPIESMRPYTSLWISYLRRS